jgi:hypothetical protein
MDIQQSIVAERTIRLKEIAEAALRGDTSRISANAKVLEQLDRLQQRYVQLSEEFRSIGSNEKPNPRSSLPDEMSAKARGRMFRDEIIEEIRKLGHTVHRERGVLCTMAPDKLLGIAYASEIQPRKWWLGLPIETYHAFVLLCENEHKEMTRFIFPRAFYDKHSDKFSRDSAKNQLKFNIELRDGLYTMKIPGQGDVPINSYIDKFEHL